MWGKLLKVSILIIIWQIENEYGPIEKRLGEPGKSYSDWAAKMALDLGTGVPWVMCKQDDAPDPVVSFAPISPTHLFCSFFLSFFKSFIKKINSTSRIECIY